MRLLLPASLCAVLVGGCATRFPLPMTAAELVRYDSGPALVAYLGQPDASPAICDLRAQGPHVPAWTAPLRASLIDGFVDGKIEPQLWRRCLAVALKGLPAKEVPAMFDDLLAAYGRLLDDADLQTDPARAERAFILQRLYLDRAPGLDADPQALASLLDRLRRAMAKNKLGTVARNLAVELLSSVDVEHGNWQGQRVDVPMLDALGAAGNEMTLTRFAERLPDPALRREAQRRLVRIHVALSPFDEVRADAAAVEEKVLREGHNRVALAAHPVVRAWFDEAKVTIRNVFVRQHVWQQTATLLGYGQQLPPLSVLPELSFRDSLWAKLQASSRPVTLCTSKRSLDPTPCLAVEDVSVDNPFAYLDKGGRFHFRDNVAEQEIVGFAAGDTFPLPVALGDHRAVSLAWGLTYERPEDLDFSGQGAGARGPDLRVRVGHPNPARYVFTVSSARGTYAAVVQADDLARFRVGSRGAGGPDGASGSDGSTGFSGGPCSDGGPGGDGGTGADGGDGGAGGNVDVIVACAPGTCDPELLKKIIFSAGGAGGSGGRGGRGGSGGSGGGGRSASTHTDADGNVIVDDPGCSAGSDGASGTDGRDGWPGQAGAPGRVTFRVAP